jgi:hypothetical protein
MTNHEEESRRLFEHLFANSTEFKNFEQKSDGDYKDWKLNFYWFLWKHSRKTMPKIKLPVFADVYASGFGTANYAVDQCKLAIQEAGYEVEE